MRSVETGKLTVYQGAGVVRQTCGVAMWRLVCSGAGCGVWDILLRGVIAVRADALQADYLVGIVVESMLDIAGYRSPSATGA